MGHHIRTAAEIEASDRAAERFFARRRGIHAVSRIRQERYDQDLRDAAREGSGRSGLWDGTTRADARRQEREEAFARILASPLLDEESRALLPVPGPVRFTDYTAAHERAARRFFDRVDGMDLPGERYRVYREWTAARRLRETAFARALVMDRWKSAPVEPITDSEYAAIARWTIEARRIRRAQDTDRGYQRGQVRPVGMSLDQAVAIAQAAAGSEPN